MKVLKSLKFTTINNPFNGIAYNECQINNLGIILKYWYTGENWNAVYKTYHMKSKELKSEQDCIIWLEDQFKNDIEGFYEEVVNIKRHNIIITHSEMLLNVAEYGDIAYPIINNKIYKDRMVTKNNYQDFADIEKFNLITK